jgi:hypothetical protein
MICAHFVFVAPLFGQQPIQMRLRVAWGGGAPQSWTGSLQVADGTLSDLRDLGLSPDSPGSKEIANGSLRIMRTTAADFNGFDVSVNGSPDAMFDLEITSSDKNVSPARLQLALSEFITEVQSVDLDDSGNKLIVRRVPGDELRVALSRENLVFTPGEPFALRVEPHLIDVEPNTSLRMRVQLFASDSQSELYSTQQNVDADDQGDIDPVELSELVVPQEEGVYEFVISLYRRGRLDVPVWRTAPIHQRTVQFVVIDSQPPEVAEETWREENTLDPTNPGWRTWATRIPGMSFLPGMDQSKPLSNSTPKQIKHADSAMLELAPGQWQAFPLTIADAGRPHLLEVEIPRDLPQSLGISVIEPNAAGEVGAFSLDSGVYVPESVHANVPAVSHHRLVFWPRTKAPLVLLVNHRRDGPAVFGRIRIYSGPERLPPSPMTAIPSERLLAAFFDKPYFPENFSASGAINPCRK